MSKAVYWLRRRLKCAYNIAAMRLCAAAARQGPHCLYTLRMQPSESSVVFRVLSSHRDRETQVGYQDVEFAMLWRAGPDSSPSPKTHEAPRSGTTIAIGPGGINREAVLRGGEKAASRTLSARSCHGPTSLGA